MWAFCSFWKPENRDRFKMNVAAILPIPPVVPTPSVPNIITGPIEGNFKNFPHVESILEYLRIAIIPVLASSLMGQRYAPKTTRYIHKEYDYVIVGAGAAGCVLANRLSKNNTLLLLEAGSSAPLMSEIPGVARGLLMTETNYNFDSEPQKACAQQLHEKRIPFSAGKGIGGSSLVNAMLYIRGHRKDYDKWAEMGAANWSWNDVYPFFHLLENNTDADFLANGCHSTGGPLTAGRARHVSEFRAELLEAAKSLGWKINDDPNCGTQDGIADHQTFTRNGQRCSAAKAYLVPVDDRPNLHIASQAFVTKIEISPETKTAVGVHFDWRNKGATHFVKARRRVIISAGALNTPKILMLSGIGPKEELEKHGIPVLVDSPVGKNFQDHFSSIMFFYVIPKLPFPRLPYLMQLIQPSNIAQYALNRTGPLASSQGIFAIGFIRSPDATTDEGVPNFEPYFIEGENSVLRLTFGMKPLVYEKLFYPYELTSNLWCVSSLTNPKGTGYVGLKSKDPYDPPKIDPKFLEHEDDLKDLAAGLKFCMDIAETPAMKNAGVRPFKTKMPGCESFPINSDDYRRCYTKAFGFTIGHQSCTAKMGSESDPTAVVTPDLRVKGVRNLNVVDASVMPFVVSGNTMVPVVMIAEKASHMIQQEDQRGP